MRLTQDQLNEFEREGFLFFPSLFTPQEIATLRDEARVPMIYVSHQAGEIIRLASQVVRIEDGRVLATGGLDLLDAERREMVF